MARRLLNQARVMAGRSHRRAQQLHTAGTEGCGDGGGRPWTSTGEEAAHADGLTRAAPQGPGTAAGPQAAAPRPGLVSKKPPSCRLMHTKSPALVRFGQAGMRHSAEREAEKPIWSTVGCRSSCCSAPETRRTHITASTGAVQRGKRAGASSLCCCVLPRHAPYTGGLQTPCTPAVAWPPSPSPVAFFGPGQREAERSARKAAAHADEWLSAGLVFLASLWWLADPQRRLVGEATQSPDRRNINTRARRNEVIVVILDQNKMSSSALSLGGVLQPFEGVLMLQRCWLPRFNRTGTSASSSLPRHCSTHDASVCQRTCLGGMECIMGHGRCRRLPAERTGMPGMEAPPETAACQRTSGVHVYREQCHQLQLKRSDASRVLQRARCLDASVRRAAVAGRPTRAGGGRSAARSRGIVRVCGAVGRRGGLRYQALGSATLDGGSCALFALLSLLLPSSLSVPVSHRTEHPQHAHPPAAAQAVPAISTIVTPSAPAPSRLRGALALGAQCPSQPSARFPVSSPGASRVGHNHGSARVIN
ncbi:hypothetical protein PSPO01_14680 [Paraphaeosphaeria sporulosa]